MAREEIEIEIETTGAKEAADDVREVSDEVEILKGPGGHVELDIAPHTDKALTELEQVETKAHQTEAAVKDIGTKGAAPSAAAMADLTGPLGEASSMASDFGGALEGAGELAEGLATKLGASAEQAAGIGAAIGGPIALGVAAVAAGVGWWKEQQNKAKAATEETAKAVRDIQTALREGDTAKAAAGMAEEFDTLADRAEAAGFSAEQAFRAVARGGELPGLTERIAELNEEIRTTAPALATALVGERDALVRLQSDAEGAAGAWSDAGGELETTAGRAAAAERALGGVGDATADAAAAAADADAAYQALQGTLSDQSAYLDAQDGFDQVGAAAAEAFAAAAAGEGDAEQAARDHQRALIDLKSDVVSYAEEVGGIPPQQVTDILAMIDRGDLAAAEAALAELERARTATVSVNWQTNEWVLGQMRRAWGGSAVPFAGQQAAPTVTINAPAGMRANDLIMAARDWSRRGGR